MMVVKVARPARCSVWWMRCCWNRRRRGIRNGRRWRTGCLAHPIQVALRGDFPDWWADAVQRTDATLSEMALADGLSGARALTPTALFAARPLLAPLPRRLCSGRIRCRPAARGSAGNGDMLRASAALLDLGQAFGGVAQRVLGSKGCR